MKDGYFAKRLLSAVLVLAMTSLTVPTKALAGPMLEVRNPVPLMGELVSRDDAPIALALRPRERLAVALAPAGAQHAGPKVSLKLLIAIGIGVGALIIWAYASGAAART